VRIEREVLKLIASFPNIKLERVEKVKHYKLFLDTPAGKKILVVSVSASDSQHAGKNNRSILKRWSKGEPQ